MRMHGRFLLDTNIVIALFAGEIPVRERIGQAEEVFLSNIVLGELYFGARKSSRMEVNLARIDELAGSVTILASDIGTAREYGIIKSILQAKGRPIPENDIWIAAIAKQHGITIATRDAHFREIEGLSIETW